MNEGVVTDKIDAFDLLKLVRSPNNTRIDIVIHTDRPAASTDTK